MKIELSHIRGAFFSLLAFYLAFRINHTLEINFFEGYNFES